MSVEMKHESDLTAYEKRKYGWRTIRSLKGKKRMQYFWDYYRYILIVIAICILLISIVINMYQNLSNRPLLTIAVVDANHRDEEHLLKLKEELKKVVDPSNKQGEVYIDTSASSLGTQGNQAKLAILMSVVSDTDIVICNQEVYDRFKKEDIFGDILELTDNQMWIEGNYLTYKSAYLCVLKKTKKTKEIDTIIDYYQKSSGYN